MKTGALSCRKRPQPPGNTVLGGLQQCRDAFQSNIHMDGRTQRLQQNITQSIILPPLAYLLPIVHPVAMCSPSIWTLMALILSGVLAVDWIVRVPVDPVSAPLGSSVVLECAYDFPEESDQGTRHKVLSEMWCLNQSHCITPRYVYHSAGIFPEPSYQGRVKYFGQTGSKNCSLMISDLRSADSGLYVFRFITDHLKAKLPGQRGLNLQVTHQIQTRANASASSSTIGIVFGVIVIIIAIAGIVIFIRRMSRRESSRSL
ncbi:uncharacterized protein [Pseudorasbora parva]|uniref:uncharacterized protein n=1 Tax=Pseudorasbora parva TaxID=51549 RepID=UPI00351F1029